MIKYYIKVFNLAKMQISTTMYISCMLFTKTKSNTYFGNYQKKKRQPSSAEPVEIAIQTSSAVHNFSALWGY